MRQRIPWRRRAPVYLLALCCAAACSKPSDDNKGNGGDNNNGGQDFAVRTVPNIAGRVTLSSGSQAVGTSGILVWSEPPTQRVITNAMGEFVVDANLPAPGSSITFFAQGPNTSRGEQNTTVPLTGGIFITIVVDESSGALTAEPGTLDFGTESDTLSFQLTGPSGEDTEWSAFSAIPWVALLEPSSGTLSAGAAQEIAVTIDRALMPGAGEFSGTIELLAAGSAQQVVLRAERLPEDQAILRVDAPDAVVPPEGGDEATFIALSLDKTETTMTLRNVGGADLEWAVVPQAPWLSVDTESGVIAPGGEQAVTLSFVPLENAPGTLDTVVFVLANDVTRPEPLDFQVSAMVPEKGVLVFDTETMDLRDQNLGIAIVRNAGNVVMAIGAEILEDDDRRLTASVTPGLLQPGALGLLTVNLSRSGLGIGNFEARVRVSGTGGNDSLSAEATVRYNNFPRPEPVIEQRLDGFVLGLPYDVAYQYGGAIPPQLPGAVNLNNLAQRSVIYVVNRAEVPFEYTVSTDADWLSVEPSSGTLGSTGGNNDEQRLSFTIDRDQRPPTGVHIAVVTVSAGNLNRSFLVEYASSPLRWEALDADESTPSRPERGTECAAYDPFEDRVLLFTAEVGERGQTWSLDMETLSWTQLSAPIDDELEGECSMTWDRSRGQLAMLVSVTQSNRVPTRHLYFWEDGAWAHFDGPEVPPAGLGTPSFLHHSRSENRLMADHRYRLHGSEFQPVADGNTLPCVPRAATEVPPVLEGFGGSWLVCRGANRFGVGYQVSEDFRTWSLRPEIDLAQTDRPEDRDSLRKHLVYMWRSRRVLDVAALAPVHTNTVGYILGEDFEPVAHYGAEIPQHLDGPWVLDSKRDRIVAWGAADRTIRDRQGMVWPDPLGDLGGAVIWDENHEGVEMPQLSAPARVSVAPSGQAEIPVSNSGDGWLEVHASSDAPWLSFVRSWGEVGDGVALVPVIEADRNASGTATVTLRSDGGEATVIVEVSE